jgi:hypothetical protein
VNEDVYALPSENRLLFDENNDYACRLDDQWDDINYYFRHDQDEELEELERLELELQKELERLEGEGGKIINRNEH